MWQALETKARFIAQVITGHNPVRRAEDVGGQELSYAEVKAIASGNPAVLTLAEADAELQRLAILKKNHLDEQYVARRKVRDLPGTITQLRARLNRLSADQTAIEAHPAEPMVIAGRSCARDEVAAALAAALERLPRGVRQEQRIQLGTYRGLPFGLILQPGDAPEVYLAGQELQVERLSREHSGPRAVLNALPRLAGALNLAVERARRDLSIAEVQLRDYRGRVGKSFAHDQYQASLMDLRDQLRASLARRRADENAPSPAELAGRIRALQNQRQVEAPPERAAGRPIDAEEPVTARIQRRLGASQAESSPAGESNSDAPSAGPDFRARVQRSSKKGVLRTVVISFPA